LFGLARNVTSFSVVNRDNTSAVIKRVLLPCKSIRGAGPESLTFLKVGLTKGSRGDWSQKDRFPARASGVPQRRSRKSWVLGKPPISSTVESYHGQLTGNPEVIDSQFLVCRQPTQNLTFRFPTSFEGTGAGAFDPLTAAANHPTLA
jgi:hypothetical protein